MPPARGGLCTAPHSGRELSPRDMHGVCLRLWQRPGYSPRLVGTAIGTSANLERNTAGPALCDQGVTPGLKGTAQTRPAINKRTFEFIDTRHAIARRNNCADTQYMPPLHRAFPW